MGRVIAESNPIRAGAGHLLPDWEDVAVLCLCEELGQEEGAASSDGGEKACGLRLEDVEYGGASRDAGVCSMTTASSTGRAPQSALWPIGLITLAVKRIGKRRTGNPFAPFEVAGAGDGLTANLHGHEAGNGGHSQGGAYGVPRQSSTLLRSSKSLNSV